MARKSEKQTRAGAKKRWFFRIITFVAVLVLGLELSLQVVHVAARGSLPEGAAGSNAPVVLCLGDSHTYGAGVSEDEAYPALLEKKLAEKGFAAEVINLGAPGTNTSEIRRKLPEWMETYEPVCVIVLAVVNNSWNHRFAAWSDAQDGLPVSTLERLTEEAWNRVMILRGVNVLLHRLKWARAPEELARDRSGRTLLHRKIRGGAEPGENINRARRDLEAIIRTVRDRHAVPVLMTYVTGPDYSFTGCNPLLRRVAKRYKVPLADNDRALQDRMQKPDGTFDQKARDKLFFPDMHARAAGYELIAENVYETLHKNNVLKLLSKENKN
ncbi:MAG: GDSL-type esterase/lipase family protein [bacterium]